MPLAIKRFDHVGFPTDAFEQTRALCEDVLGLEPVPSLATGFGKYRLAWYRDDGGTEYHVSQRIPDLTEQTGSDFNQSMYPHVAFEVESLEDAKAYLTSKGFEYHELKGEGILVRKQLYVLLEEFGMMLELFETRTDVEPTYVPPEATR
jgi:catechol 2,3-dioxygenase-like lactoylglutathione lyase family enzyme